MAEDFEDWQTVVKLLEEAQDTDQDNRDAVREAHHFLDKRNGQWDPYLWNELDGRPRYTFDKCNPIIDGIAGEIEQADFDIRVRPAGGDATKDIAMTYDGLIRNIEAMSNASDVYSSMAREMIASGFGAFEIVNDWADSDSFEQDLLIRPIWNAEDRVWFTADGMNQTMSNASGVWLLTEMAKDKYDIDFPKGSGQSVGENRQANAYFKKKDHVTVGRFIYKKKVKKELILFSDNSVREANEDLDKVIDELAEQGITEVRRSTRESHEVWSRLFDGDDWLADAEKTVFKSLPVIPMYGNFKLREGKIIYRGEVEKLMDPARAYNSLKSREIEEVVLSPRAKWWMTPAQMKGHETTLATLNTNADPVQPFNVDDKNPGPPQQNGGAQVNPGLLSAVQGAKQDLIEAGGQFGVSQGDISEGPLSGVAIQSLQNKGDTKNIKYFKATKLAVCQGGKVLMEALPITYDNERQVRVLNEDGSFEMVTLNERVFDDETGQLVTVNDLRVGKYDVTCDVGPAFKNRQQETVKALQELYTVIPGLAEISADIHLQNIASPGVDLAAERVRRLLLESGQIPESQLTDDEKEEIAAAQEAAAANPPPPDPQTLVQQQLLDIEQQNADTRLLSEQAKAQNNQEKNVLQAQKQQIDQDQADLDTLVKTQQLQMERQNAIIEALAKGQETVVNSLATQAQTLKTIREAMGVDTIIGPHAQQAFINQADLVTESQQVVDKTTENLQQRVGPPATPLAGEDIIDT